MTGAESDGGTSDVRPISQDSSHARSSKSGQRALSSPVGLHSPVRANKRRSTVAVAQLLQGGEYRVFPLSKYQKDGWEPFLPKNPLEGTTLFGIAKDFEARRRRLDVARNTSLLHADDDDWKRIASKRTARRLAKEGIAADATGMGAVSKGVVLVDAEEVEYLEPPWYEPTQDQIKKFLRAEAKRVWSQDGRLDALVQRILKETKQVDEGEDEGYEEFEEDDYRTALRVLAKLHSRPRVLCCAITLTGSGSVHFVTKDKKLKNRSWVIFKRAISESLGLTEFEIAIVSATATTVGAGTMSESVDVDFRICTPHAELAEVLAELIEECVEDGSLGRTLTMFNLQSLTSLRKGPAIFEFPGGYDSTEMLFGEQAVELRRQIAAWEHELMMKKQKVHRRAEAPRDAEHTQVYEDHDVEHTQMLEAASAVALPKRKRFKVSKSDTLEVGEQRLPSPRPPHGFALHQRPQSSLDRIQAYAPLQSSHSRDGIKRPNSEMAAHREEKAQPAADRWGVGLQTDDVEHNSKLADYFKSRVGKKANPQRGDVTAKTKALRSEFDAFKAANVARMKEERDKEEKHRADLMQRTRSVGGWGDEPTNLVKAMEAVIPSIEDNIQNARFRVQARTVPARQTRIQSTPHSVTPEVSAEKSRDLEEKSGLAALSMPKHVTDAVEAAELGLEEVLECTEEELMELTGLGQLDCWRLKKKLAQMDQYGVGRRLGAEQMRERARQAQEERARLKQVGSRLDTGWRESFKVHKETVRQRLQEKEEQREEQRRSLAELAERSRERLASVKHSVDAGSKIIPQRSVTEQRSGLSAFSEHSEHAGLGWAAEPTGKGSPNITGTLAQRAAQARAHAEMSRQGSAVSASHGDHSAADSDGERSREQQLQDGQAVFKGASTRTLVVEGAGSGLQSGGVASIKPRAPLATLLKEARKAQQGSAGTLDGPGSAMSVHSMPTPSRQRSHRHSRSATRQSSVRSRRKAKHRTDHDESDASDAGGFSPFPKAQKGDHSADEHEELVKASKRGGSRSRRGSVDSATSRKSSKSRSSKSPLKRGGSKRRSKSPQVRTHGPRITLPGQWSNLLNDVLPDTSKAKPTMKKTKGKKKARRRSSAVSFNSDDEEHLESIRARNEGPCLCCKGTKKLVLADLPEYLQEILPAIGKMEVDCPLCCPLPRMDIVPRPPKKQYTLKPWSAKRHRPEDGKGVVVVDEEEDGDDAKRNPEKKKRSVAGVAIDRHGVTVVVVFNNGELEEFELLTGTLLHAERVPVVGAIFSVCKHNNMLYLGMDSCIQEISLPPHATLARKLKGQDGEILCLAPVGSEPYLVSGSRSQTTFLWDLDTGRVKQSTIALQRDLPRALRSFAEGLPASTQSFAFRHHNGPVACCSATKGVLITGGWDGLLCVVSYNAYKDRWLDERVAGLLRDKKAELKRRSKELQDEMATFKSSKRGDGKRTKSRLEVDLTGVEDTLSLVNNTLVAAEARLKVASTRCRKFLYEASRDVGRVTALAFTALENKTYGLFAGYSDGKVRQWDVSAGTVVHVFLTWTPMSVTSVCLGIGRVYCGYANGLIKVWDLTKLEASTIRTQKNDIDLLGHQDGVAFMGLCDNLLFSCADDKTLRTWDLLVCDPDMTLPLNTQQEATQLTASTKHARLQEAEGAVMRVLVIPERTSSIPSEGLQVESESTEEEESEPEPETPLELQELSASLPFDPAVYTDSKAGQNELLSELLEIGHVVENLSDSLTDQTIKARAFLIRHPTKPVRQASPPPRLTSDT